MRTAKIEPDLRLFSANGKPHSDPLIFPWCNGGPGTENPEQPPGIMPGRETCCVPLCPNNFKYSHGLAFYRIPKARRIRREYVRFLWNDDLNLNSDSTRICSAHWDGG